MTFPLPTQPKVPAEGMWGYDTTSGYWKPFHLHPSGYLYTEDTGKNTNPRKYEKDRGFSSPVVQIPAGGSIALYTYGTTPSKTSGTDITIYSLHIDNRGAVAGAHAHLYIPSRPITPWYYVNSGSTIAVDWPAGNDVDNNEVYVSGTSKLFVQVFGTEE